MQLLSDFASCGVYQAWIFSNDNDLNVIPLAMLGRTTKLRHYGEPSRPHAGRHRSTQ